MTSITNSPPRAPAIRYTAPLGTRWEKEKAAAGRGAFEYPDDPTLIGPWIIGECVGKGASGRVKIAKHCRTGQLAAVKILPLQPLVNSRASLATQQAKSDKQRLGIDREITMMKLMNHPNIMRIYDVYEGEKELYLVLEYVKGGELFDYLVNRGRLPPLEALVYFKQIVYGLNYAHTFSIIHRDLKPENILIHSFHPPLIKIADWGMAAFAPPALQLETSCGSPHYASPEIINGEKYEGNATDIWSCGVILYALLTGRLPFDDKNVRSLLAKVTTGKYDIPAFVDPEAKDLLTRMLVVDVSKRITIPQILKHHWLSNFTPGIVYVPAPPVSELARPLPSDSHIDSDLYESLRVIWGRHADFQNIRADLLSPAGEGVLAKAFYFLLERYRERTLGETGILVDMADGEGKVVTKQYVAPLGSHYGSKLDVDGNRSVRIRSSRVAPPPPPLPKPHPQPKLLISGLAPPVMERSPSSVSSRPRPASPIGPRAPKERPISSPVSPRLRYSHFSPPKPSSTPVPVLPGLIPMSVLGPAFEAAGNKRRSATVSSGSPNHAMHRGRSNYPRDRQSVVRINPPAGTVGVQLPVVRVPQESNRHSTEAVPVFSKQSTASPPQVPLSPPSNGQNSTFHSSSNRQHLFRSPAVHRHSTHSTIFSPARQHSLPQTLTAPTSPSSATAVRERGALVSPRIGNAEFQRTIHEITEKVNVLAARETQQAGEYDHHRLSIPRYNQPQANIQTQDRRTSMKPVVSRLQSQQDNKENGPMVGFTAPPVPPKSGYGGLGFSQIGREMGNVIYVDGNVANGNGQWGGMKGKEKRNRTPMVEIPPHNPKRLTMPSSVSPLLSPPTNPSSLLTSPALGEVKGWFSNLFNWKAHSYVLGSGSDLNTTRYEVRKLLEQLGVDVEEGDILRCIVDDQVVQRQVKFRVEFSAAVQGGSGFSHTHSHPNSPNLQSQSPNPQQSHRLSMNVNKILSGSGYTCAIMMVLEKGSVSTFRSVYRRLREEWRMDEGWDVVQTSPGIGGWPGVRREA